MLWAIWFVLGCAKTPVVDVEIPWEDTPRLPSPHSSTYSEFVTTPNDTAVASIVGAARWDASLSGAAASVALAMTNDKGGLSDVEIREAAWSAGWLHPVLFSESWTVPAGSPPPPSIKEFVAVVPPDVSIGLVRARNSTEDVWVALLSRADLRLGVLPRHLPVGGRLELPAIPNGHYVLSTPLGGIRKGPLDRGFSDNLSIDGEWLVEVTDGQRTRVTFPVYIDIPPPLDPLFVPGSTPGTPDALRVRAAQLLETVRREYGLDAFRADPMLQQAAPWAADASNADELAPRLGFARDELWRWSCKAPTVASCIANIVWDPRSRPALFEPNALLGIDAKQHTESVALTVLIGRTTTDEPTP